LKGGLGGICVIGSTLIIYHDHDLGRHLYSGPARDHAAVHAAAFVQLAASARAAFVQSAVSAHAAFVQPVVSGYAVFAQSAASDHAVQVRTTYALHDV
jgi:hypothetical protein